jgi:hypothetical protein
MAKENKAYRDRGAGFQKPIRNRGEDIDVPKAYSPYAYQPRSMETEVRNQERAINRNEARGVYDKMNRLQQERDQRSFQSIREMENEFYAGVDPRRRQELADAGMIREDANAMANLPRQAIHHEYPQAGYYFTPYIDDTLRGEQE